MLQVHPKPRPTAVCRTVKHGRVRIFDNWYYPDCCDGSIAYDGRLDEQRCWFGLYYEPLKVGWQTIGWQILDYVSLWGTDAIYQRVVKGDIITATELLEPYCIAGLLQWGWWRDKSLRIRS